MDQGCARATKQSMHYEQFVRYVERVAAGGLDWEDAERTIAATFATLVECLPRGEAHALAEQLPLQIRAPLVGARPRSEPMSVEEFLERLADREGVSPSEALHHARAVMEALTEAVTGHELQHVRDHLPDDFATLFAPPAAVGWPETHRHRPHP